MEDNLYSAPKADVSVEKDSEEKQTLASRWARFCAAFLDGLVYGLCFGIGSALAFFMLNMSAITESNNAENAAMELIFKMYGIAFLVAIPVMVINAKMIMNTGQTIGKRAMKIKTVKQNGDLAPLGTVFGLRWLVPFIITLVPLFGGIFSLVNILFIFRGDKKCIHDLIAGTQVVNA